MTLETLPKQTWSYGKGNNVLKGHKPAPSPWDVPWSATSQMRARWGGENSTQLEKKKKGKNGKKVADWRLNIMLHREQDKLVH